MTMSAGVSMLSQAPIFLSTHTYMSLYILSGKKFSVALKKRYDKEHSVVLVERWCYWNKLKLLKKSDHSSRQDWWENTIHVFKVRKPRVLHDFKMPHLVLSTKDGKLLGVIFLLHTVLFGPKFSSNCTLGLDKTKRNTICPSKTLPYGWLMDGNSTPWGNLPIGNLLADTLLAHWHCQPDCSFQL